MQLLKKLGRGLNSSFLKLALTLLAVIGSAVFVFGSSGHITQSLSKSNLYTTFIDNAVTLSQQNSDKDKTDNKDLPLDRPEVVAAVKTAVTPQFLQSTTENVIDSMYRWLDGKTAKPDFVINLAPIKENLKNALGDYVAARAKSLPTCTLAQLRQMQNQDVEPLDATCLPPGVTPASLRTQFTKKFLKNDKESPFKDLVITADNLGKKDNGEVFYKKLDKVHAPQIFRLVKLAPFIFAAVVLFCAIALVLLYDDHRRGLRAVGIITLGNGIFLLVTTWLFAYLFAKANKPSGHLVKVTANNPFQNTIITIVRSIDNAFNQSMFKFCVVYILIGAGILITLKLTTPKTPEISHDGQPPVDPKNTELPAPRPPKEVKAAAKQVATPKKVSG